MEFLRLWIRLPLAIGWTLAIWSVRMLLWPVALYSEAADRKLKRKIMIAWGVVFKPLIGMRVVVHGRPPEPPFYMVANHLSYIDMWALASVMGCSFVARGDLEHWPVIGQISKSLYVLFINRESKKDTVRVNQLIEHALKEGDGMVVFAESRISPGRDVEPFKSALIEPAVANGVPVHYATLNYETRPGCPPASRVLIWWRPEPFFYHLFRMLRCRGFTVNIHFGEAPISGTDRKGLTQQLHAAVKANFVPHA